jgi:hypothetical protein
MLPEISISNRTSVAGTSDLATVSAEEKAEIEKKIKKNSDTKVVGPKKF